MNNSILVVDPAWSGPTGWLKYDKELAEIQNWGTLKASETKNWTRRFDILQGIKTLIIENTFMKKNVRTYGLLERARMLWMQPAIDHFGLTEKNIIEVAPRAWQSVCQRGWKIGMDKDQKAIEFYIRHRWFDGKGPVLTDHEISCFGMLSWYEDKMGRYILSY